MKKTTVISGTLAATMAATAMAQEAKTTEQEPSVKVEAVSQAQTKAKAPEISLDRAKEISSYFFGYRAGMLISQMAEANGFAGLSDSEIKEAFLVDGFKAALKGAKPAMEQDLVAQAADVLSKSLQEKTNVAGKINLEKGNAFLAENGKRKGVATTASGFQYEVLTKGSGTTYKNPAGQGDDPGTTFKLSYKGTLIDGTVFDQSAEPVDMPLQVIEGFKEALTTMPTGSKWKIFLPAKLAYGEQSMGGGKIPPQSTLIFEIELKEITYPKPAEEKLEKASAPASEGEKNPDETTSGLEK